MFIWHLNSGDTPSLPNELIDLQQNKLEKNKWISKKDIKN